MRLRPFILLTLFLTLISFSCNKATPTGFWKDYKTKYLVSNIRDQGPYGGHRAVYWKSEISLTFDTEDILDFATKNGWTLSDSSEYDLNQTKKWTYHNKLIFPLTSTSFSNIVQNNSTYNYFPRWFSGNLKLYKFKTGWVTIEPGTGNSFEQNGFVLLNQDKSEFAVYHLWGE